MSILYGALAALTLTAFAGLVWDVSTRTRREQEWAAGWNAAQAAGEHTCPQPPAWPPSATPTAWPSAVVLLHPTAFPSREARPSLGEVRALNSDDRWWQK